MEKSKEFEARTVRKNDLIDVNRRRAPSTTEIRTVHGNLGGPNSLQILGPVFVSDDIIEFYSNYLLSLSEFKREICIVETLWSELFENPGINNPQATDEFIEASILLVPLNVQNQHWKLCMIIKNRSIGEESECYYFESLKRGWHSKDLVHVNRAFSTENQPMLNEMDFQKNYLRFLLEISCLHQSSEINLQEVNCTQQGVGSNDCGLCVLKTIELIIQNHQKIIESDNRLHYFNNEME